LSCIDLLFKECNVIVRLQQFVVSTSVFLDDDDNESTSTQDDEEGDSSANILAYCGELVSAVLEMKDSHGRVVCHLFKKLPPQGVSISSKIIVTHCGCMFTENGLCDCISLSADEKEPL